MIAGDKGAGLGEWSAGAPEESLPRPRAGWATFGLTPWCLDLHEQAVCGAASGGGAAYPGGTGAQSGRGPAVPRINRLAWRGPLRGR